MSETPNPRSRGLGRGLNALFEDEETGFDGVTNVELGSDVATHKKDVIGIEQLYPSPFQPRHVFDEPSLQELADSIKQHGVLQPLLVRKNASDAGEYEIIGGERRWRAAQKAQLHEVPVIVLEIDDTQALEIALIENLQREDLNPIDEAMGYQKLMQDFGHTQEKLAKAMGKSRSHIANMVRLLNLPPAVQEMVADNGLSTGHARALITSDDPVSLAKDVLAKKLTVRETEALVNNVSGKVSGQKKAKPKSAKTGKDADTLALESQISNNLGMNVAIDSSDGQSGRLVVEFKSLDQLDDLINRLSQFSNARLSD
ncbi:MAG: ParB/RepB/Spo0J family partition protein [Bdellovibrionales bacterium]